MVPSVRRIRDLAAGPIVVVKHTFLEVVGAAPTAEIRRSRTEPSLNEPEDYEVDFMWDQIEVPREPSPCHPSRTRRSAAAAGGAPREPPAPCTAAPQPGSALGHGVSGRTQTAHMQEAPVAAGQQRTTLIMRNLPPSYASRSMLLDLLNSEGFRGKYNFVYLPINFNNQAGLGYAFVNLTDPAYVADFWAAFDGYTKWALPSEKVCQVAWSGQFQGLDSNIERYRNSAVMHVSIPEEYKPCMLVDGVVTAFPRPTKALPVPPRSKRQ